MRSSPDLAAVARLVGEPTRAEMLGVLLGGQWLTSGELARAARISAPTASEHLARLEAGGLVVRRRAGRHQYVALAGPHVATMLESLARFADRGAEPDVLRGPADAALRFARTCYDHLAGRLGVAITSALVERGLLANVSFEPTVRGEMELRALGVDVAALHGARRPLSRPCLDWSERRDHLAGALGSALLTALLDRAWLARSDGTRAVRLTLRGREGLRRAIGLELEASEGRAVAAGGRVRVP